MEAKLDMTDKKKEHLTTKYGFYKFDRPITVSFSDTAQVKIIWGELWQDLSFIKRSRDKCSLQVVPLIVCWQREQLNLIFDQV